MKAPKPKWYEIRRRYRRHQRIIAAGTPWVNLADNLNLLAKQIAEAFSEENLKEKRKQWEELDATTEQTLSPSSSRKPKNKKEEKPSNYSTPASESFSPEHPSEHGSE